VKLGAGASAELGGQDADGAELFGGAESGVVAALGGAVMAGRAAGLGRFRVDSPVADVFIGDVGPVYLGADVIAHRVGVFGHLVGDEVADEGDQGSQRQPPEEDAADVGAEQSGHGDRTRVRGQEGVHDEHGSAHWQGVDEQRFLGGLRDAVGERYQDDHADFEEDWDAEQEACDGEGKRCAAVTELLDQRGGQ
jgi:hypothetical protein